MDARTATYAALDAASAVLALGVTWFFARSERLLPERGFGILALAFGLLGLSYAANALAPFGIPRVDAPLLTVVRASATLLASLLLLLHYLGKRWRWKLRAARVTALALAALVVAFVAVYAVVPLTGLPDPLPVTTALRLGAAMLLIATSFLVILEVRARSLWDFRVPLAFLCLALSSYTVAVTALAGAPGGVAPLTVFWRLAALAMLLSVIWPSRRFAGAPA